VVLKWKNCTCVQLMALYHLCTICDMPPLHHSSSEQAMAMSPTRTPSLINAGWSSEHAAEDTDATSTATPPAPAARPQNFQMSASNARHTFHATSLSFAYNDEEDFIIDTHNNEDYFPRSLSQPNLMRTNLTNKPTRGNLTRNPSTGSLVSIEVLQELVMMDRSARSIVSHGSSGFKSSRASKCSNCSSRQGSVGKRSFSSEGDAQEDMDDRGWRARVLQLKQFAIMDGLFGKSDERESLRWNPFSSNTPGSRRDERPIRRSLPGSHCNYDSDTKCSDGDDRNSGPFRKTAQGESEKPSLFRRRDIDDISNLSPHSDGLLYKQPRLEVRVQRRASDPPTSPTLSFRTTISNTSHVDEDLGKLQGSAGTSSNNVCDMEKSPLLTSSVELTMTQGMPQRIEPQLPSIKRDTRAYQPYSSSMKENCPDGITLTKTGLRSLISNEEQQRQSLKDEESANLKNLLLGLYNELNAQKVDDEHDEPADITLMNDFAKAARRKSFQKSLSESFQSGDFDYQFSDDVSSEAISTNDGVDDVERDQQDINEATENKRPSQTSSRRQSFESYKQRNSARMRRRPTVESEKSETGKSAVSSLDSLASPTLAAASPPCHLTRSQFTNMAVAPLPIKRENSIGSLSSLGTESIDRDGIKAEDFLRKHSNEHSANAQKSQQPNPNVNAQQPSENIATDGQEPDEKGGWVSGDQSSITMGTFFTQLQKTLTQGYQGSENRSATREAFDSTRRRSGASSVTLGTFLNGLQTFGEDCSVAESNLEEDQVTGLNDMCDFDSGLASYLIAMRLGHFDCHDNVIGNIDTDEDDDCQLAAKAYMGLGFAAQITGENESAIGWYMKSLQLWETEIGAEHPSLACLHYTIGVVLSQERNELEASVHFNNAIGLLKANEDVDETIRASILFTEGMILSVLGEASRAIECLKKGLLLCQTFDLNHATVMYEMGTLLAQQGELEHAINCYKHSLSIRERSIGNSFTLMQTHYSLGVTLAEDGSPMSKDYAMIHLQEALKLCGETHIQSPTIIHALGVLSEKKGDYHAAANWFYKELNVIKSLFGEGKCIHC
jgi:tetratricopeptide (TPR) repeat protein